jgi:hypothetical protein
MAAHVTLRSPAQGALVRAVVDVTSDIPASSLRQLDGVVLQALVERLADRLLIVDDPLGKARLRGALAQRELLSGDGGALSGAEVATLLGVSRQAVDKRRKAGQLFAVELPRRGYLYPAWQLTGTGVLPGVAEVLAALRHLDPWAQARFFVSGNARLGGKRPLDRLRRGDLDAVLRAAGAFDEHGAA